MMRGIAQTQSTTNRDTYGGLAPHDLSRVIVAYDSGHPTPAGWPVGYAIFVPAKRRIGWVREAFGPTRDASALARVARDPADVFFRKPCGYRETQRFRKKGE